MSQVVYDMDLFVIDSHGAYTNVSLSVTVTDVNNNPPITDQTEYEGQVIGQFVGDVIVLMKCPKLYSSCEYKCHTTNCNSRPFFLGDALAPLYTGVTIATTDEDGPSNALLTYVIIDDDARLYFEVLARPRTHARTHACTHAHTHAHISTNKMCKCLKSRILMLENKFNQ